MRDENKGFKTAFYEYYQANEYEVGPYITRVYSIAINTYQRLAEIEGAIDAIVMPGGWGIGSDEVDILKVLIYEAVIHGQRLRMGGRLPKVVKTHLEELK